MVVAVLLLLTGTPAGAKTVQETAAGLYRGGIKALKKGAYERSVSLISRAIELSPTEYRYYNDRGVAFKRMGKLQRAIEDYTKALQIKPDYTNALNNRGVVYLELGNHAGAIRDFDKALQHGGLEAKILTNRGLTRIQLKDYPKAIDDLRRAITYRPLDYRAFLYLGESLEKTDQTAKALKMYQLARGLVKDRNMLKVLKTRIATIEKSLSPPSSTEQRPIVQSRPWQQKRAKAQPLPSRKKSAAPTLVATELPRTATPVTTTVAAKKPGSAGQLPPPTLASLNEQCRARAIKSFSDVAADIYQQGKNFLDNSDSRKAVIRFQDSLQLARRQKNVPGVAWCLLEIGRAHLVTGEYFEALPYLQNALKLFLKLNSRDESLLTLAELARASRAAGLEREAESFEARAVEMALSAGYEAIAGNIGRSPRPTAVAAHPPDSSQPVPGKPRRGAKETAPGNGAKVEPSPTAAKQIVKETAAGHTTNSEPPPGAAKQKTKAKTPEPVEKHEPSPVQVKRAVARTPSRTVGSTGAIAQVGRGPYLWGRRSREVRREEPGSPWPRPQALPLAIKPAVTPALPSKRMALSAGREKPGTGETAIRALLHQLKGLKQKSDEARMIRVLEELGELYWKRNDLKKSLHCFDAAVGFREKLGRTKNISKRLHQIAVLKENLGELSEALEASCRAAFLAKEEGNSTQAQASRAKSQHLANRLRLDPATTLPAFENLWNARLAKQDYAETRALHRIAEIFHGAGKHAPALNFYDRTAASLLLQKADVLIRIGKDHEAKVTQQESLQTLKRLDYSKYLQTVKKKEKSAVAKKR